MSQKLPCYEDKFNKLSRKSQAEEQGLPDHFLFKKCL